MPLVTVQASVMRLIALKFKKVCYSLPTFVFPLGHNILVPLTVATRVSPAFFFWFSFVSRSTFSHSLLHFISRVPRFGGMEEGVRSNLYSKTNLSCASVSLCASQHSVPTVGSRLAPVEGTLCCCWQPAASLLIRGLHPSAHTVPLLWDQDSTLASLTLG